MTHEGKLLNYFSMKNGIPITCMFNKKQKFETHLIGVEDNEFIILKFPYIPGVRSYLVPGSSFAANLTQGGSVIFFSSYIDTCLEKKLLALCAFPQSFKLFELRGNYRIECLIPVGVSIYEKQYYGVVKDISSQGCHIIMDASADTTLRQIKQGDPLKVELGLTNNKQFLVSGTISHLRQSLSRISIGMNFTDLSHDECTKLTNYMSALQHNPTENH